MALIIDSVHFPLYGQATGIDITKRVIGEIIPPIINKNFQTTTSVHGIGYDPHPGKRKEVVVTAKDSVTGETITKRFPEPEIWQSNRDIEINLP